MIRKKTTCTCCLSSKLISFIDFGEVPLAGAFIHDATECVLFPLSLSFCSCCSHVQVNDYVDMNYLFKDYRYASGYSMMQHFDEFSRSIDARFGSGLKILEIGSNDGTFLSQLVRLGNDAVGVEPAANISKLAIEKGLNVICGFFSKDILVDANVGTRSMDLITASNCFAHIEDIDVILVGVECALKDDGTFIVEVHYGPNLFATGQYDFIYHEHMYYYSLRSLSALLNRHGFSMYDVDFIPTHGGSIRAFIQRSEHSPHKISDKLNKAKEEEIGGGFSKVDAYIGFRDRVHEHMSRTRNTLQEIKSRGHKIVAFGASGRANAFLNYANVDANTIDFIIDESPERAGRYVPKVMIPIKPLKGNENASFDCLFITAWNFREQILVKTKNMNFSQTLDAFPEVCISIR